MFGQREEVPAREFLPPRLAELGWFPSFQMGGKGCIPTPFSVFSQWEGR
jgi:hypothetical protein